MKKIIKMLERREKIQNEIKKLEEKIWNLKNDNVFSVEDLIDEYIENRFGGLCKKKYKGLGYQNTFSYFWDNNTIQTVFYIEDSHDKYFRLSIEDFKDIVSIKDKKEAFEKLLSFETTEN